MIVIAMFAALGLAMITEVALDYNEKTDKNPQNLWHRILRFIHRFIGDEDEVSHA